MAFTSEVDKDKKFGSRFKQRKFDQVHAAGEGKGTDKPGMEAGKASPDADTQERDLQDNQEQTRETPADIVKAHGPAHTVTVHHNHVEKKHKVISHHEDAHMHESEHGSPEEAYQHAQGLASEAKPEGMAENAAEGAEDMLGAAGSQNPA